MMERYRVTFDVDGDCWWEVDATSPEQAREAGIARFRAERFWAQRYPETPPCTVERLSALDEAHGDVGPFR
jgi:hypothetical protein